MDSTYLLPIVGVNVEGVEGTLALLKKLRDSGVAEYYYTQFNILEIVGKLSRVGYNSSRALAGLASIFEEFIEESPTVEGVMKALELRRKGHRDLIDLLLYTTSLTRGLLFLTRDVHLVGFLKKQGEPTHNVILEEELAEKYGQSPAKNI
ncbi:hypothetical protein Tpen_1709 [Thermofilum pendens Hrk 5]|uniref:PIN domain-containing protein n=1 Tax=Thermofilum pendens (strain DSM 2475 / Hrk 5) TaxID=368408 RepID=A1S0X4_THEPD|nr:hypothetical protein Tpen_1709 [Thermofilum pendens Hrk 5]